MEKKKTGKERKRKWGVKWFMCRSSAPIPAEKDTKTHLVCTRLHILYAFTFDTIVDILFDGSPAV